MNYIPRAIISALTNAPQHKAILLFGARQVGKTTLLKHIIKDTDCLWFSGDEAGDISQLNSLITKSELESLLTSHKFLVIDEAQKIEGIGLLIKRMVDLKTECKIYITSSGSLELAGGVYESAAGRTLSFNLWPFSFEELSQTSSVFEEKRVLNSRLVLGSYPETIDRPREAVEYLRDIYQNVAFKDIFSVRGVKSHTAFIRLMWLLASRIGQLCSYESLAQECRLSSPTVETYISLLEECFLIKSLPSFSRNLSNELKKSKKIYFYDLGLRNAILNNFSPFDSRPSEEQGALFENYFIIERIKQASCHNNLVDHYFWRNRNKSEIDLIETYNDKIRAFDVKLSRSNVKAPPSFLEGYPKADFIVVNRNNYDQYLSNWDWPIEEIVSFHSAGSNPHDQ